eukprot:6880184-Alexandrium_andersonii.AAC.1
MRPRWRTPRTSHLAASVGPRGLLGSAESQETHLPEEIDCPPVAPGAEGIKEVARLAQGAPRRRNRRTPDEQVFRCALAKATQGACT